MKYQEFFASRGIPVPQQFIPFTNVDIDAAMLPTLEQQYPAPSPNAMPAQPAQPAVAATATTAPQTNRWPSVFMSNEDVRANGGEIIDLHSPVESRQHKGMMIERAMVRLKFAGTWIQGLAYTSTKRDATGNVIGYHTIAECSNIQIAQDPQMPGRYSFKLTPTGISPELLAKATVAQMANGIDWSKFQSNVPLA